MARQIQVTIVGDASSLQKAFSSAAAAAGGFGGKLESIGSRIAGAGDKMTRLITTPLLAAGAAGVKVFADFESSLNSFQAVSGATAKQMDKVHDLSIKLGNDLKLPGTSAKDAAEAMTELSKGGLSVRDSMDAARATIQLAIAAQVSEAEAAGITADALNAFGLSGKEAGRVADLLAASANATTADIGDMALALKASSAVAAQLGVPIQDTVAALGELANAGIKGSDAGTSLKTMLLALAAPTKKSADLMKELGFRVFDAHGKMLPLPEIIDRWAKATEGLSDKQRIQAERTIFGTDAIRAAQVILDGGAAAFDKMAAAVTRAGAAQELAASKSKGVSGAIDAMKSSLETAAIKLGEALAPSVSKIAGFIADIAEKFSNLPSSVQNVIVFAGGIVAALGPVFSILGRLTGAVGGVISLFGRLGSLGSSAATASGYIAGAGAAATGAAGGVSGLIGKIVRAIPLFGAIGVAGYAAGRAIGAAFRDSGKAADDLTNVLDPLAEAFQTINQKIAAGVSPAKALQAGLAVISAEVQAQAQAVQSGSSDWQHFAGVMTMLAAQIGPLDPLMGKAAYQLGVLTTGLSRVPTRTDIKVNVPDKDVQAAMMRLLGYIDDGLGQAKGKGERGGRELTDAMRNALNAGLGPVKASVARNVEEAGRAAAQRSGQFRAAGVNLAGGLVLGINSKKGAASSAGKGLANAGASGARSGVGQFAAAGAAAGQGFASGIASAVGAAVAAAANIVNQAAAAARAAAQAHSPSRVTMAIGSDIGQGLVMGFLLGTASLPSTVSSTVQRALEAAQQRVQTFQARMTQAFSDLASNALAAFDRITQEHLTKSEQKLKDLQAAHDQAQRDAALAQAQTQLAQAQAAGDQAAIVAAQQAVAEAQYAIEVASLQQQAEAERQSYEDRRELQRRHLEEQLAKLQAELEKHPERHREIQRKIQKVLKRFLPEYAQSGRNIGLALAEGLRDSIGQVRSAAEAVAQAIANALKTASPTKEGPMSDLDRWWDAFAPTLISGLDKERIRQAVIDAVTIGKVPLPALVHSRPDMLPAAAQAGATPVAGQAAGAPAHGGDTYVFQFPNYVGDRRELERAIVGALARYEKRNGDYAARR